MKKLLFIGIVALMVQSLGAVTLPSTSYSPYSASAPSDGSFTIGGGTMVTGTYSALGVNTYGCVEQYSSSKDVKGCQDCCDEQFFKTQKKASDIYECYVDPECSAALPSLSDCKDECARSLNNIAPLDGGLTILLILSLAGGAAKLLRNRDKE